MLSRERITVFTQVFSDKSSPLTLPEFVFQGKGTRIKFNQPKGTKVIGHQRHHIRFTQCFTRSPIYQIDTTCSRKVIMASLFQTTIQFTLQTNLEKPYWQSQLLSVVESLETSSAIIFMFSFFRRKSTKNQRQLMIEMLPKDPNKIPSPSRDDIMKILSDVWNSLDKL